MAGKSFVQFNCSPSQSRDFTSLDSYIYLHIPFLAPVFSRKFAGNSLPPVMGLSSERLPHTEGIEISLDTDAVVQTIRDEAARIAKAASTA